MFTSSLLPLKRQFPFLLPPTTTDLFLLPLEVVLNYIFPNIDSVSLLSLSFTSKAYCKIVVDNIFPPSKPINLPKCFACAIQHGYINITDWLCSLPWIDDNNHYFSHTKKVSYGVIENDYYTTHASAYGQLSMLKHLTKLGYHWGSTTYSKASKNGHLDILTWIFDGGEEIDLLNGVPNIILLGTAVAEAAASGGQNHILNWLKERGRNIGYKGSRVFRKAVKHGHLNTMQWLIDNESPTSSWKKRRVFKQAAKTGNIKTMRWLKAHDVPWSEGVTSKALISDKLPAFFWLVNNGCPYSIYGTFFMATTRYDKIPELLQWLTQEKKFAWPINTFQLAIRSGQDDVMLQWLFDNNCPIFQEDPTQFCRFAAEAGCLPSLKWLRQHGYEWNEDIVIISICNAQNRHGIDDEFYELAKWAIQNGCPWVGPNAQESEKFLHYDDFIQFYNLHFSC
jgi:hypothetical protein